MCDANNDAAANGICLPYDVLLQVLRRLPGRPLAKFRLVCRAWRGIVDAHSLLLPHVFPREFPGVFTTYYGYWAEYDFFAPPGWRTQPPQNAGEPTFVCPPFTYEAYIQQHCNGLLLLRDRYVFESAHYTYVCNPATRREDRLPLPPTPWRCDVEGMFLAFDPAVSRHHQVFLFPKERTPPRSWDILEPMETWWVDDEHLCLHRLFGQDQQEMHSLRMLRLIVFSSRTGQWEMREFLPGCCSSGRLYDLVKEPCNVAKRTWWSAEYWHGSLYIHCHSGVLMILRCSERTYDTVELPSDPDTDDDEEEEEQEELRNTWTLPKRSVLASYEIGVHYVVLNKLRLHVWMLTESTGDELGWILTHKADLRPHDNVLDFVTVQPRMRWEVVGCSKRDLYGIIMNREIMKNNQACLSKYNSHERSNNVEEDDNHDKAEELNSREGCGHLRNTEEHSDISMGENVASALGLEGESDDDETTRDDSEYSWNSNKHNFIDIGEGIAASLVLEEDGEEEDDGDDDEAEEDAGTYGSQHTDDIGWGCRIVGFHPHKNVLLLHLSHVGVAYHLDTSRMQYLGYMFPKRAKKQTRGIHGAFPYRPCFIDALPV